MHYVYILKSAGCDRLYRGHTDNIKRRISQHNHGEVNSTKAYRPWKLIYCECFTNKADALREELFLKSGKGKERLKYLLKNSI